MHEKKIRKIPAKNYFENVYQDLPIKWLSSKLNANYIKFYNIERFKYNNTISRRTWH